MITLVRGQKIKLADMTAATALTVSLATQAPAGLTLDISCFGVDAQDKLSDERYFIFYNQKTSPCGSIKSLGGGNGDQEQFAINLAQLPAAIRKLVFVITLDGNGVMAQIQKGYLRVLDSAQKEVARFAFAGADFGKEKAVIVGELYFKEVWRLAAVGQGFNGGLSALLKHFGGTEATPAPAPSNNNKRVMLEKRIEQEAPQLVSLVKKAKVSLEKVGLQNHTAKVALCLDVSGSMSHLYSSGIMQKFAERILALGCRFDDDGSIDIFLFADRACNAGEMQLGNLNARLIQGMVEKNNVGGGTSYGPAMQAIRQFYFPDGKGKERKSPHRSPLPVFVMFVTDGDTGDESVAENQVKWSSYEPMFWQFIAIGNSGFRFLKKLDTLSGRYLDNANFFAVDSPERVPDDKLYDLLMTEYPSWVKQASSKGLMG